MLLARPEGYICKFGFGRRTVGDQGNDEVVLGELSIEGLLVTDVEGDGGGTLNTGGEGLGGLEGSAG